MNAGLSARTRLIALLGDPVEHSLSPQFQNAAIRELGLDAVYLALRCDGPSVPALLRGITLAGGAGNVTVPHKLRAWDAVDRRTPAADQTRACNTFWLHGGEIWGDNTDVAGFARAAESLLGAVPRGARVLVAGAGGAARAAVCALLDAGAAEIALVARNPQRAESLARGLGSPRSVRVGSEFPAGHWDLAVNATPLGLRADDPSPVPDELSFAAALDLVYRPGGTPWVRGLRARGVPAADGTEMLVQQGAAAFRCWFGVAPPLAAMRSALGLPP